MPKIVKLYGGSRRELKHNMGGWFEKKKPEPAPKTEKKTFSDAGKKVKESILERNRRLKKEALTD